MCLGAIAVLSVLETDDIRAVAGLLGEVAGFGGDVGQRRQRLVAGLSGLIAGDIWYWVQSAGASDHSNPAAFAFQTDGWRSKEQQALVVSSHHSSAGGLINTYFQKRFPQNVTCIRADVASDAIWYASELYQRFHEPAGIDDFLMSVYHLPGNIISGLGFYRLAANGRFSLRHRAMVHLVMEQVGWLHRGPTEVPAAAVVPALSPRCRETLLHLLSGDSRKQIAHKLHVSENTVSDYIKSLHRQFGVSSRGELMAKFLSGAPRTA
jgi:DNA-binding CsgD family transcriptional regulator